MIIGKLFYPNMIFCNFPRVTTLLRFYVMNLCGKLNFPVITLDKQKHASSVQLEETKKEGLAVPLIWVLILWGFEALFTSYCQAQPQIQQSPVPTVLG